MMVDPTRNRSGGLSGAMRAFATALDGLVRHSTHLTGDGSTAARHAPAAPAVNRHDRLPDPATYAQDNDGMQADLTWLQGDDQMGAWEALEASLRGSGQPGKTKQEK
ncbi:hypothetical protein Mmc1_1937 [Magnetococcus marinus MC-1]|uniref:Uncharacterized protein n=1 Tax=Magnetococcus marinus (strain ATCC BAA-1437 / JCM 17883 / MC-1) TaxID=156889 RepID=A0L902_MAGMM|nr:hypothetical protein [Magnetococcus marinus]ABK44445.1 hypothetical protein Mmc1_1937 [Magnetococcus marinus MC-1]